jgi:hypothetical protein
LISRARLRAARRWPIPASLTDGCLVSLFWHSRRTVPKLISRRGILRAGPLAAAKIQQVFTITGMETAFVYA